MNVAPRGEILGCKLLARGQILKLNIHLRIEMARQMRANCQDARPLVLTKDVIEEGKVVESPLELAAASDGRQDWRSGSIKTGVDDYW